MGGRVEISKDVVAKATGFDHVSVTSSDLEASIAFYSGLLGLPVAARGESEDEELSQMMDHEGVRIRWADIGLGGGAVLELIQFVHPRGTPVARSLWDPGATHIGLQVDDAAAVHERLRDAQVRVVAKPVRLTEEGSWHGVEALYAIDPDGVWIELVQRPDEVTVVYSSDEDDQIVITDRG
jgi:catechol 2,3-dioxygenase-like lactoylglutathione lyase family enzyme